MYFKVSCDAFHLPNESGGNCTGTELIKETVEALFIGELQQLFCFNTAKQS